MTRGIWIVLSAAIGFAIIMVQRDLLANEEYKVKENDTEGKVVLIPAGDFWMGCNPKVDSRCKRHEKPGRRVHLDAYRIDKTEVTLEQFEKCVQAGSCQEPKAARHCNWGKPGREKHPVNCVDWFQAKAYCEWMGKRLPTEAEWEKAARGQDGRMYPWGSESASCEYIVTTGRGGWGCGKKSTWPVCSKKMGNSPYGLCDVAGNVWEWVVDWYEKNYYASAPGINPRGPTEGKHRVIRGGSWPYEPFSARSSNRRMYAPDFKYYLIGFRCARTVKRPAE